MSFKKIDKSTASRRSSTVSTRRLSLASQTGSVSRRPSESSLNSSPSFSKESNPPITKPAQANPHINLSATQNISSEKLDKRNASRSSSIVPARRPSLSSLSARSYTSLGTSQAFTELIRSMKAVPSASPCTHRFKPEYKCSSEAYRGLPPTERNAIFVEVTFFTDNTHKEVSLKADSLFVPQRHPFELQRGTPAYEYAEMIARAALAKHAAQGIIKPGRTYGWLPLLFKVKAIEQSPRYGSESQVLADIESIPVAYDDSEFRAPDNKISSQTAVLVKNEVDKTEASTTDTANRHRRGLASAQSVSKTSSKLSGRFRGRSGVFEGLLHRNAVQRTERGRG